MDDELLNIVDENDEIIGTGTRGDIHSQGLRHRVAHILVLSDQGEIFLQKRSYAKEANPGLWDTSAAGHVDAGETYDECARREVEEELGVILPHPPKALFKFPASKMTGMEFCQVYYAVYNGPFILNWEETDKGQWFSAEELNHWIANGGHGLTKGLIVIWRQYLKIIQPI